MCRGLRTRLTLLVMFAVIPSFGYALYSGLQHRAQAVADAAEQALNAIRLAAIQETQAIQEARLLLQSLATGTDAGGQARAATAGKLRQSRADNPRFVALSVAEPDGRLWCRSAATTGPDSVADQFVFQTAVTTGRFVVGPAFDRTGLECGYPVLTADGRLVAVWLATLEAGRLAGVARTMRLPAGGVVRVVDQSGRIVDQYPAPTNAPADRGLDATLWAVIRQHGREGVTRCVTADGDDQLFAYATVAADAGLPPLYLSVVLPAGATFAPALAGWHQSLLWLGIVGLLGLLTAAWAARRLILDPVNGLTTVVQRLARGELSVRTAAARAPGELGALQRAFDEMAESVQQSTTRLQEAETRYRAIVEQSPAITYVAECAAAGRWRYVSPQVETMLGYTPAEWQADAGLWLRLIDPDDRDRVVAEEVRSRETGEPFSCEYRLRTRTGAVLWVRDQATVVRDADGQPATLTGIIHDITELKGIEAALRESEERFRCLSASSPMGILLTDVDGRCVYANPRLRDILGLSLGQTLGDGWLTAIHAADRLRVKRSWTVCSRRGREFSREFRVTNRQGAVRWMHMHTGVMVSDRGQRIGHVGTVVDITERKTAEDSLRETNRQLEQTLRELQQTQQQALQQERLRALGQVASGVAHDFNNALAKIIGFTDLLLSAPGRLTDPVKLTGYLDMINTAAHDAANVVTRLREFYRKRDDTEVFQPLDLNRVVQKAVSLTEPKWRQQAQASGVTVTVHTDLAAVSAVPGNEADLREALTNLIFNAVDAIVAASRDGSVTLRTRAADGKVALEIADTGCGMTEEVRQRLFEPFFTTKGERGTGLGLAAVFGIVQRHGGEITVASDPGRGTTFRVMLPTDARPVATVAPVGESVRPRPLRVLLAEDEPVLREIEVEYLTGDGHQVVTADNGRDALEKFAAAQFDLVVADQAMPEMNGAQLAAAVKRIAPDLPVIMVTGFGDLLEATSGPPGGADLIVGKPLTQAALRRAIVQVISARAGPAPVWEEARS